MHKTLAEALAISSGALLGDDVEDRRKDTTSRAATLGRRASARRRVLLTSLIVDLDSGLIAPCRVENVSGEGARIKLAERRFLPPAFWLIAVTAGLAYRATTVWRDDDRLGVEVGPAADLNDPANAAERRLRQIWVSRR
jgi:hypothetical protein